MNELIPPWKFLNDTMQQMNQSESKSISIRVQTGLPYLCLRLALLGHSSFVILQENQAETCAQDLKSLSSLFETLKDWSIAYLHAKYPSERVPVLEESVESKGLTWFGAKESFLEKCYSKEEYLNSRLKFKVGKNAVYSKLVNHLSEHGYKRVGFVEEIGDYAVRGEVFDFWTPNYANPVRLIFSNDVIESMHFFDVSNQRTISFLPESVVVPLFRKNMSGTVIGYLPGRTILIVDETALDSSLEQFLHSEFKNRGEKMPMLKLSLSGTDCGLASTPLIRFNWNILARELAENDSKGIKNFVFCKNMSESQRVEEILDTLRLRDKKRAALVISSLSQGFQCSDLKISVWSFRDLTGSAPPSQRLPKFKIGRAFDSMFEIQTGDFVVHESYGIGRYRGLERLNLKVGKIVPRKPRQEKESEFLVLEYRAGDRLLVPMQDFRMIQKYIGSEGKKPQLYSLDGVAWERVKQKVREEVVEIARELIRTAALRASITREQDEPAVRENPMELMQKEFADLFSYEETPDQMHSLESIKQDLKSNRLMDRLVCGDTGYGKTEIAMRAAFQVVCDSKQVAVLVPTTILAEQHFKTFMERFSPFPVKIEMLSRFQKPAEQKKILVELKNGDIDILIGTHRLIQPDVHFKNLGLIVIDEEHRFGVEQKESLKKLKLSTDMLSLSATPIPRTLSMSLSSIREISIVETPPEGRLPIETFVGSFNEEQCREAILRELDRGGQVFYVHNRIATIENRKRMLEKLFPQLQIGIAHGKMNSKILENAMWNFLNRKWDILLSTSIIESGLDIPNVNTIIIEDSEEFGLAQLYQLRGRVGRQRQKAYCYLFFSQWAELSEDARKRLEAIHEFSSLGSGMKLALRDLEIRGAGNLLGPQQHGWISAVGFDLYCHLLAEEINKLKSEKGWIVPAPEKEVPPETLLPDIELNISAYIPDEYVEHPGERISLYKKMIACRTMEDIDKLKSELLDRFGSAPPQVHTLLRLIELKIEASKFKVTSIVESDEGMIFGWSPIQGSAPVDFVRLAQDFPNLIEIIPPDTQSKENNILRILFKEDIPSESESQNPEEESFKKSKKFLQISAGYVTIDKIV